MHFDQFCVTIFNYVCIIESGEVIEVQCSDLIAEHVGGTKIMKIF